MSSPTRGMRIEIQMWTNTVFDVRSSPTRGMRIEIFMRWVWAKVKTVIPHTGDAD